MLHQSAAWYVGHYSWVLSDVSQSKISDISMLFEAKCHKWKVRGSRYYVFAYQSWISSALYKPECPCSTWWWSASHTPRSLVPPRGGERGDILQAYSRHLLKQNLIHFNTSYSLVETKRVGKGEGCSHLLDESEVVADQHHAALKLVDGVRQGIDSLEV